MALGRVGLGPWSSGPLVLWSGPWSSGALVLWSLVPWSCGSATPSGLFFSLAASRPVRGPQAAVREK